MMQELIIVLQYSWYGQYAENLLLVKGSLKIYRLKILDYDDLLKILPLLLWHCFDQQP